MVKTVLISFLTFVSMFLQGMEVDQPKKDIFPWEELPVEIQASIVSYANDEEKREMSQKVVLRLNAHNGSVYSVCFDHKDRLILGSFGKVYIVDTGTGARKEFKVPGISYSISPDPYHEDKFAVGSADSPSSTGRVCILDTATGAVEFFPGGDRSVYVVAHHPHHENIIAEGSNYNTVRILNAATKTELKTLSGLTHLVNSVAFNSEGTLLASGADDTTIRVWDPETDTCQRTLTGHTHWVNSVAFNSEGTLLASGSWDGTVRLWDLRDLKADTCQRILTGHTLPVRAVAFNSQGTLLASGSDDGTARLWDLSIMKWFDQGCVGSDPLRNLLICKELIRAKKERKEISWSDEDMKHIKTMPEAVQAVLGLDEGQKK